jgi:hypothetical protein
VGEQHGSTIVVHTLETDLLGRFERLESGSGAGLLTLHREADGSVHGNRVTERGVDHLRIEAPAPALGLVGSTDLGVAALLAGLVTGGEGACVDVIEVLDDLGVRVVGCSILRADDETWELRTDGRGGRARRVVVDGQGLPTGSGQSWPLEKA